MTVVRNGKDGRAYPHILYQLVRRNIHYPYQAGCGITAKVQNILQECKIHDTTSYSSGSCRSEPCREVYRYMFIADCRLELRFIAGRQPVNSFLLYLFRRRQAAIHAKLIV